MPKSRNLHLTLAGLDDLERCLDGVLVDRGNFFRREVEALHCGSRLAQLISAAGAEQGRRDARIAQGPRHCHLGEGLAALPGDGSVHAGHHLGGKQLHRAAAQRGVHPVVAGVHEVAEVAHVVAEREDLVHHRVDGAGQHQALHAALLRRHPDDFAQRVHVGPVELVNLAEGLAVAHHATEPAALVAHVRHVFAYICRSGNTDLDALRVATCCRSCITNCFDCPLGNARIGELQNESIAHFAR